MLQRSNAACHKQTQFSPFLPYHCISLFFLSCHLSLSHLTLTFTLLYAFKVWCWIDLWPDLWSLLLNPPHLSMKAWLPWATNVPALSEKNAKHCTVEPHLYAYLRLAPLKITLCLSLLLTCFKRSARFNNR